MMLKQKCSKESYTSEEMCKVHNRYRLSLLIIFVAFLWVIHHYGISDVVMSDISGGKIVITENQSFGFLLIEVGKWIAGVVSVLFAGLMFWNKYIKKK